MSEEQQPAMQPPVIGNIARVTNQLVQKASAETVFGQPVQRGETIVIPCAEVIVAMGIGGGSGSGSEGQTSQTTASGGGGEGAGAGGRIKGRPVAVIVITPGERE